MSPNAWGVSPNGVLLVPTPWVFGSEGVVSKFEGNPREERNTHNLVENDLKFTNLNQVSL